MKKTTGELIFLTVDNRTPYHFKDIETLKESAYRYMQNRSKYDGTYNSTDKAPVYKLVGYVDVLGNFNNEKE